MSVKIAVGEILNLASIFGEEFNVYQRVLQNMIHVEYNSRIPCATFWILERYR